MIFDKMLRMKLYSLITLFLLTTSLAHAMELRRWSPEASALQEDLELIQKEANWDSGKISFKFQKSDKNTVSIVCENNKFLLDVKSQDDERAPTLYHGLFHLGFLFPHPRIQISPSIEKSLSQCGKTFEWRPAFKNRGFHLHTLHPTEFMEGFLEGKTQIALDAVRWHARNRQNILDLSLVRGDWENRQNFLKAPFALAKSLGISRGVALGIIFSQQRSFKLLDMKRVLAHLSTSGSLLKNLQDLQHDVDIDFLNLECGSSEFSSVNYDQSLSWLNLITKEAKKIGIKVFTKVHVSTNQKNKKYGNFNFLPQFANNDLGLLPHTVMFYSLYDKKVPMYGNKDFSHILNFMLEQKDKRDTWYYPETSYWVYMDIDVPLLLTDYLGSRALDMKNLYEAGIKGQINFTTGQEAGYWLFDWTLTLNNDLDLKFDPQSGLKLLGEDRSTWKEILDFQTKHFKDNQLIAVLSFSNIMDELIPSKRIHQRNTVKELSDSDLLREDEILRLSNALEEIPNLDNVKNEELKIMLKVTHLRIKHALSNRLALRYPKKSSERDQYVEEASESRRVALKLMATIEKSFNRYPETSIFTRHKNSTSYNFGYLWQAVSLKNWEREEQMVKRDHYSAFFMNNIDIMRVSF
jgi:hypothetical protein